jgi:hypothetical protein
MVESNGRGRRVLILGAGQIVRDRYHPALAALAAEGLVERVTYLHVRPAPSFELDGNGGTFPEGEHYARIPAEGPIPFAELHRRGLIGGEALVAICTPSRRHVAGASLFAERAAAIAVEEPIAHDPVEAMRLVELPDAQVFPVDHFNFKQAMIDLRGRYAAGRTDLDDVTRIEFTLMERPPFHASACDDAIADLAIHGLALILSLPFAEVGPITIEPTSVLVASYGPAGGSFGRPGCTAARIRGLLRWRRRSVRLDLRVGKGLGEDRKAFELIGREDRAIDTADLGESGWAARGRALRELLTRPLPDMRLSLADAAWLVGLCARARAMAQDQGTYLLSTTPAFFDLAPDPRPVPSLAPAPAGV